ncbi:MAG: pantoate--beta-alanine ligase [Crocinitomicaceae bacterium]|nr:pantoate--beta-alanine ligase [Crocinitomicaceae bacterium]MBP6033740.1 pantoate--beta-alanine ligase [Crocinitomicaceae bacterium]
MSKVKVIHTAKELHQFRQKLNENSQTLGFVPTMGALHDGHLSLIKKSADENDYTLISIFVNPKQFNNSEDLKQYPRTLEADLTLLEGLTNCVVFAPDEAELYPKNDGFVPMELGSIGRVLEGAFRPGHFEGVVHVVHNLFRLVEANQAYFGQKDFQQLAIIRLLTKHFGFQTRIIACPTVRESNGLAMSSRNMRLSKEERQDALIIIETLRFVEASNSKHSIQETLVAARSLFEQGSLSLEYLAIVDPETLHELKDWQENQICCIAAHCGSVRLIDNLLF